MRFMWLPIIESVCLYLRSLPEIAERYEVDLIGNLQKGGGSSIEIDWEAERGAAEVVNTTGAVAVHLLIKHRTDDTDVWRAFREQYRIQNRILVEIRRLHDYILTNLKIAVKISATGVEPLGNRVRPYYGNELILVFEWKGAIRDGRYEP